MSLDQDSMTNEEVLTEYFQQMTGKMIEGVGLFDNEIVIILDDLSEVCLWCDDGALSIQINERAEFDD